VVAQLELEILICAPNGCADARVLLEAMSEVDLVGKKITILEFAPNCTQISNPKLPIEKVEHRHFDEFGDIGMRRESFLSSQARWMVYLEDHALPDGDFFSEIDAYLNQKNPADAMTFYSKNGTPDSVGSRAVYHWVWGESEVSLFPKKPAPVCSAFLVNREAAIAEINKRGGELQKGELEMQIIPELVRRDQTSTPYKIAVLHFEDVNLFTAIQAVASNGRVTGNLEKELLPRKGWLQHMLRRYFQRSSRLRGLNKYSFVDSICLELMAVSGFVGVITGRYFGIGKAELELAHAHPAVKKR
jgi:hypothetical protein